MVFKMAIASIDSLKSSLLQIYSSFEDIPAEHLSKSQVAELDEKVRRVGEQAFATLTASFFMRDFMAEAFHEDSFTGVQSCLGYMLKRDLKDGTSAINLLSEQALLEKAVIYRVATHVLPAYRRGVYAEGQLAHIINSYTDSDLSILACCALLYK